MHTIVTAALQRQYLQMEFILWIHLILASCAVKGFNLNISHICVVLLHMATLVSEVTEQVAKNFSVLFLT
jgi:hypothetical protein